MARGTVVRHPSRGVGVVLEAKPVGAPTRALVAWEPLADGRVEEVSWPPTHAHVVRVLPLRVGRAPRAKNSSPAAEPVGFVEWLEAHVREAARNGIGLQVPRAGTTRRARLAITFARLLGEGYDLEAFTAASVGVLSDEYMRINGHVDPENVLRVEKIGRRVDAGRRELERRAAAVAGDQTDWSRFDGA